MYRLCGHTEAAKGRRICLNCKNIRYKNKHPIKAAYYNLKHHAKSRGKEFDLTIEQFEEFCIKTEYINKKGRDKNGYHVDRIDESRGYTIDNIQTLTNSQNIRKYIEYSGSCSNGKIFKTKTIKEQSNDFDEDCPF